MSIGSPYKGSSIIGQLTPARAVLTRARSPRLCCDTALATGRFRGIGYLGRAACCFWRAYHRLPYWPNRARPTAAQEAEKLFYWMNTWAKVLHLPITAHYEQPLFEQRAQDASRDKLLATSPRCGNLLELTVDGVTKVAPSPIHQGRYWSCFVYQRLPIGAPRRWTRGKSIVILSLTQRQMGGSGLMSVGAHPDGGVSVFGVPGTRLRWLRDQGHSRRRYAPGHPGLQTNTSSKPSSSLARLCWSKGNPNTDTPPSGCAPTDIRPEPPICLWVRDNITIDVHRVHRRGAPIGSR